MGRYDRNSRPGLGHVALGELPGVPALSGFGSFGDIAGDDMYEDCDAYLHAGPYAIYHVRDCAGEKPYPRTCGFTCWIDSEGVEHPREPRHARPRAKGWRVIAGIELEDVEGWGRPVRTAYVPEVVYGSAVEARSALADIVDLLRRCAGPLGAGARWARVADGWCHTLSVVRDADGSVALTMEVGAWGFYRFAVVSGAPPELVAALLEPAPRRALVPVTFYLDPIFDGDASQDIDVWAFGDKTSCLLGDEEDADFSVAFEVSAR